MVALFIGVTSFVSSDSVDKTTATVLTFNVEAGTVDCETHEHTGRCIHNGGGGICAYGCEYGHIEYVKYAILDFLGVDNEDRKTPSINETSKEGKNKKAVNVVNKH